MGIRMLKRMLALGLACSILITEQGISYAAEYQGISIDENMEATDERPKINERSQNQELVEDPDFIPEQEGNGDSEENTGIADEPAEDIVTPKDETEEERNPEESVNQPEEGGENQEESEERPEEGGENREESEERPEEEEKDPEENENLQDSEDQTEEKDQPATDNDKIQSDGSENINMNPEDPSEVTDGEVVPEEGDKTELYFEEVWNPENISEVLKNEKWKFHQNFLFEKWESEKQYEYKSLLDEGLESELYELLEDSVSSVGEDFLEHTIQLEFSLGEFDTESPEQRAEETEKWREDWELAFQNALDAFWLDYVNTDWFDRDKCELKIIYTGEQTDEEIHWSADAEWKFVCKYEAEEMGSLQNELLEILEQYECGEQEKEEYISTIYKYFKTQTSYMLEMENEEEAEAEEENSEEELSHANEAFGVLTWKEGKDLYDEEGLARAFKLLCDQAGIPCVISSECTEDEKLYTWNYICLDGENWHTVDIWRDAGENEELSESVKELYLFPALKDMEDIMTEDLPMILSEEVMEESAESRNEKIVDGPITSTIEYKSTEFNGSIKKPKITVKKGTQVLKEGTDYSLQYRDNTDAGTASVSVIGKGNYSSYSETKTFQITARDLSKAFTEKTVTVDFPVRASYTGNALTIVPYAVKWGNTALGRNKDYRVKYKNSAGNSISAVRSVGTYYMVLEGMGNYKGTISLKFQVTNDINISGMTVSAVTAKTYTGSAVKPTVKVTDSRTKTVLKSGTHYKVSYTNNVNAGTATIIIDGINGKGYTGRKKITFTISRHSVAASDIKVSGLSSSYYYTGSKIQPALTLKCGTRTLKSGTDYKVSYSSNINPGTAKVVISGIGNYCGSRTLTFKIRGKIDTKCVTFTDLWAYTGKNLSVGPSKVEVGGKKLVKGTDYTISYQNASGKTVSSINSVGKYKVVIQGKGNYTGKVILPFEVTKDFLLSKMNISAVSTQTYNGTGCKPKVTIQNKQTGTVRTLKEGTHYTLTYANNINAGKATVTITCKKGSGYAGRKTLTFTIQRHSVAAKDIEAFLTDGIKEFEYTGNAYTPKITVRYGKTILRQNVDYKLKYVNNREMGIAGAVITGIGNYSGSRTVPFTILGDPFEEEKMSCTISGGVPTYTGKAVTPEIAVTYDGKTLKEGKDYQISYTDNVNVGTTARYTIKGIGIYSGKVVKSFEIAPADLGKCQAEYVDYWKYTGEAIEVLPASLKYNGEVLVYGKDYLVSCSQEIENVSDDTEKEVIMDGENSDSPEAKAGKPENESYQTLDEKSTGEVLPEGDFENSEGTQASELTDETAKRETDETDKKESSGETPVKDPGSYRLTVNGIGNFKGSLESTFEVTELSLIREMKYEDIAAQTYTGKSVVPALVIKDEKGNILRDGEHYRAEYTNNINAGKATVIIQGITEGGYAGSFRKTFSIKACSITSSDINYSKINSSYTYTGKEIKPSIKVTRKSAAATLKAGADYQISYSANKNAGTAKIVIKGIGNYSGSKSFTFKIARKTLSKSDLSLAYTKVIYDGTNKQPGVTLTYNGIKFKKNTDYKVSYTNCKDAGTGTVTIQGINNFSGTVKLTYTISKASVSSAAVSLTDLWSYTGKSIAVAPGKVKVGSNVLVKGTDYTISYKTSSGNAISTGNIKNVGNYQIVLKGIGNYTGSVTKTFRITKNKLIRKVSVQAISTQTYTGGAITPKIIVTYGTGKSKVTLKLNTHYKVTYSNNKLPGTATVKVQGITKGGYEGVKSVSFKIERKSLSAKDIKVTFTGGKSEFKYTGKAQTPSVKVTFGNKTLVKGTDYKVTYLNNREMGVATVRLTGLGNYCGTRNQEFVILGEPFAGKNIRMDLSYWEADYTGKALTPKVKVWDDGKKLTEKKDYVVSYSNNVNAGTAKVKIKGIGVYSGYLTKEFKILPVNINRLSVGKVGNCSYLKASNVDAKIRFGSVTLKKGKDYTITYKDGVKIGTNTITIKGTGNYTGSKTQSLKVSFSESDKVTLKSCMAVDYHAESGKLTIQISASSSSTLKKLNSSFYIIRLDSFGKTVLGKTAGKVDNSSAITVSAQLSATDEFRSAMMSKYALAVKVGDNYQQISRNALYIQNPEATASMTEPYNGYYEEDGKVTSKKGLQGASEDYMEDLGVQHVLLNVDLATLVSTKARAGYVRYSYKGKTYYFQDLNALVQTVRYLNGWDNDNPFGWHRRNVTLNLLLGWKDDVSYLIHPSARRRGAAPYYTLNMKEKKARETFEALFCYMGERLGDNKKSRVCNWVLGNEVNCCQAWNYSGGMSLQDCVSNYAEGFQLLNQGIKRTASTSRLFISLDHSWAASNSGHSGKAFLDTFASYMNKTAPAIQWNMDYHPYSQPLNRVDFWRDGANTTGSSSTPYISMKNIKVLTDYLGALESKYGKPKGSIRVILGEQGFSAVQGNSGSEKKQAAALGYGYYIAAFNNRVDAYIIRSYLDDPAETRAGLYLGLMSASHKKKLSYDLYKFIDTQKSEAYMKKYLSTVGISSWKKGVSGFNAAKLTTGDF